MSVTISKLFQPTALTTTAAPVYTLPPASVNATSIIRNGKVRFTNTTAGNLTVTAYLVPAGNVAGSGNAFMTAEALTANTHSDVALPVMAPGDQFAALASGAGVTVHCLDGVIYNSP